LWHSLPAVAPVALATLALVAVVGLGVLVALALVGAIALPTGALTMLPALVLAAIMLARPYLGEQAIARLRASRARRTAPAACDCPCSRSRGPVVARGGRLIAAALAGRAPPAALAGC
jgi:hypothetical protein